jgi:hypothetical protein
MFRGVSGMSLDESMDAEPGQRLPQPVLEQRLILWPLRSATYWFRSRTSLCSYEKTRAGRVCRK